MEKIYYLIMLGIYAMATLGGTLCLFYEGFPQFGITNLFLSGMAFPYVKDCFKKLTEI